MEGKIFNTNDANLQNFSGQKHYYTEKSSSLSEIGVDYPSLDLSAWVETQTVLSLIDAQKSISIEMR